MTGLNDMGQLGVGSLDIKVTEEPIKLQGISGSYKKTKIFDCNSVSAEKSRWKN